MTSQQQYFIVTIGCAMNQSDSERLAGHLNNLGWQPAPSRHQANLAILVTCGIRQGAEDRIYGLIKQIKQDNPKTTIALTGCLAYRQDLKMKLANQVDYWFNIGQLANLAQILKPSTIVDRQTKIDGSLTNLIDYLQIKPNYQSSFSALVPIGNGCDNYCSYCMVPYARGRETYRPAADIIQEIKQLLANGYQEITIIAQNVNSYRDPSGNLDFAGLLEQLDQLGDYWLRFATSHPKDINQRLIETLGTSRHLSHHLHLPIQSGSDRILKAMNRRYTNQHYRDITANIRHIWPDVSLTTDIIVGFPGETETDFQDTQKLIDDLNFDQVYIAQFSPRPGTAAARLPDDVPNEVKKQREVDLDKIVKKNARANRQAMIGQIANVLIDEQRGDNFFGRTDRNHGILLIPQTGKEHLIGQRYQAKITAAQNFGLTANLL